VCQSHRPIKEQNDSGVFSQQELTFGVRAVGSSPVKVESLFELSDFDVCMDGANNGGNNVESDDSDSLFSITKSVPVQSLMGSRASGSQYCHRGGGLAAAADVHGHRYRSGVKSLRNRDG